MSNQAASSKRWLVKRCPDATAGEWPLQMTAVNAAELCKEDEEELGSCHLSK